MKILTKKGVLLFGLIFGVLMVLLNEFLLPSFQGEEVNYSRLAFSIPLWLILGLAIGFFNRHMQKRSLKKSKKNST